MSDQNGCASFERNVMHSVHDLIATVSQSRLLISRLRATVDRPVNGEELEHGLCMLPYGTPREFTYLLDPARNNPVDDLRSLIAWYLRTCRTPRHRIALDAGMGMNGFSKEKNPDGSPREEWNPPLSHLRLAIEYIRRHPLPRG